MQFNKALALLSAAATVSAWSNGTVVWVTTTVDSYTTVCPASGSVVVNGHTYTNTLTESSTITITDCPCTVSAPVTTVSSVAVATSTPVFANSTTPAVTPVSTPGGVVGTTSAIVTSVPTSSPSPIAASGGNKAFAMSGAALAGVLGLAAFLL